MSTSYHQNKNRVSRREFFKRVGVGLLATIWAMLNPHALFASPLRSEQESNSPREPNTAPSALLTWTKVAFENCIGQTFAVYETVSNKLQFKLLKVSDGINQVSRGPKQRMTKGSGECFLLTFQGPRNPALQQGTYKFEQSHLGEFSMFIVPGDTSANGHNYVAVINRVRA